MAPYRFKIDQNELVFAFRLIENRIRPRLPVDRAGILSSGRAQNRQGQQRGKQGSRRFHNVSTSMYVAPDEIGLAVQFAAPEACDCFGFGLASDFSKTSATSTPGPGLFLVEPARRYIFEGDHHAIHTAISPARREASFNSVAPALGAFQP